MPFASLAFALVAATRVLYLNFSDGHERFQLGDDDDAPTNTSAIDGGKLEYPAFLPGSDADARDRLARRVIAGVHRAFLPYDVQLATTRPAAGPYTMVVIGGAPTVLGFESTVGGVAVLDCTNANESNIVFVFPVSLRSSAAGLITTVAQEAAHSYGLEHSSNPSDFMYPRISPTQERFADEIAPISGTPMCGQTTQSSHGKLLAALGPWPGGDKPLVDGTVVDVAPPTVRFVSPPPGQRVTLPFTVTLDANDDVAVTRIDLAAAGAQAALTGPPLQWTIERAPAGALSISAIAHDAWGNEAGATLPVEVLAPEPGGGCAVARRGHRGASFVLLALAAVVRACRRARRRL